MCIRYEFFKLDDIDIKVACWITKVNPKSLRSFFDYLATTDRSYKEMSLDVEKLLGEFKTLSE
jgi:hypothetical protein